MKDFNNIDEILDFAISNEQQAAEFYDKLASDAKDNKMKETFAAFANEEKAHKFRLTKIKQDGKCEVEEKDILDLKISDYLISVAPSSNMSYQEALILAMKREKVAFKLYMKLSDITPNEDLKRVFKDLAVEEAKHKLKFELEYDDIIYDEN